MAKTDHYETQYRQWRNFLGLAIGALWIAYWWIRLSAEESAALAALAPGQTILGDIGHWWQSNSVAGDYSGYKTLAVISSPLSFVVSRYIARWHVGRLQNAERRDAVATQERQLAQQAADLDRIRKAAQSDAEIAQRANERHELITRIGDVDAQLLVFESEKDQERRTRMLLNLTQFIYEIHAKFPGDKLTKLLLAEDVLPKMIEQTLAHMRKLGLEDRNFYTVLKGMLPISQGIPPNEPSTSSQLVEGASSAFGA